MNDPETWFGRATSRWQDWPARELLAAKHRLGLSISVVIPARNEERTVAGVVGAISRSLVTRIPLIDELVVIDSDSTDATAAAASAAGARSSGPRRYCQRPARSPARARRCGNRCTSPAATCSCSWTPT